MSLDSFLIFICLYTFAVAFSTWCLCMSAKRGDDLRTRREIEGAEQSYNDPTR